jgi:hypothetical protein
MDQMAKRDMMIADRLMMAEKSLMLPRATFHMIRNRVRSAHKYVFDRAGCVRLAEVIRDSPDILVREHQFARAPFDVTYIELAAFDAFWTVLNNRPADDIVPALGFLVDHDTVYTLDKRGDVMPLTYHLNTPWAVEEQLEFVNTTSMSRIGIDGFLWGTTYNLLNSDERRVLRAHHAVRTLPLQDLLQPIRQKVFTIVAEETIAGMRTIIATLLLLNRKNVTVPINEIGHHRGFHKGKQRVYMAHTVMTIHIDPIPTLRKIGTPAEASVEKRRHEVMGTWCHDQAFRIGEANGCLHDWVPHPLYIGKEKGHLEADGHFVHDNWLCQTCNGHRWRRDQHMRGNSLTGYVDKTYKVTV